MQKLLILFRDILPFARLKPDELAVLFEIELQKSGCGVERVRLKTAQGAICYRIGSDICCIELDYREKRIWASFGDDDSSARSRTYLSEYEGEAFDFDSLYSEEQNAVRGLFAWTSKGVLEENVEIVIKALLRVVKNVQSRIGPSPF